MNATEGLGDSRFDVLIVGAGHGGAQAAIALRQLKFPGTIAIVSDDPDHPYERPPLSKDYLSGEKSFERILIRPVPFWSERGVEMLLGRRIMSVDPASHKVGVDDGMSIGYKHLIWAAGGSPRRLACSGGNLRGVHTVRTRADADKLIDEIGGARRAVVVGGGYIGLEAAAVLAQAGKQVTVLEALDRVLARVAGEPLSRFYEAEHRAHGVDVRLCAQVDCLEGNSGYVTGVRLQSGEALPCEMVIVGIGIVPAVQPLIDAGADGGNGVTVDARCRTTLPDIFAVGDCAAHRNDFADGATIRVESVQNALDQASVVAKAIIGDPVDYHSVPWFWSNQYDLRLQTIGLSIGFDQAIVRGNIAARSFSIVYTKRGHVIALDCVNATKDYVQGRKLVEARAAIPAEHLKDPLTPLKHLLPA